MAFGPGGTTLATSNGSIYLWDVATHKITATLTNPHDKSSYRGGVRAGRHHPGHWRSTGPDYRELRLIFLGPPGAPATTPTATGSGSYRSAVSLTRGLPIAPRTYWARRPPVLLRDPTEEPVATLNNPTARPSGSGHAGHLPRGGLGWDRCAGGRGSHAGGEFADRQRLLAVRALPAAAEPTGEQLAVRAVPLGQVGV
jgi:hypothetical protein